MTPVRYGRLSRIARDTIRWWAEGVTIAGFIRHWYSDGAWAGDTCGCVDDRCVGYHHHATDECQCLPAWLEDFYQAAIAASWWTLAISGSGSGDGWLRIPDGEHTDVGRYTTAAQAKRIAANWRSGGYTVEVVQRLRDGSELATTAR